MGHRKTDFKALRHRRAVAMARTELRDDQKKPEGVSDEAIETAIKAGKFKKIPPGKKARR